MQENEGNVNREKVANDNNNKRENSKGKIRILLADDSPFNILVLEKYC